MAWAPLTLAWAFPAGKSTLTDSLVAAAGIMSVEQVRAGLLQQQTRPGSHDRRSSVALSTSDTAIGYGSSAVAFVSAPIMNVFELLDHAAAAHWPGQLWCLLWPVDCMVLLCLCDICDRLEMPA